MRLHVRVSLLFCGLVNFLNGSITKKQQPQILCHPTTVAFYTSEKTPRSFKLFKRSTSQNFMTEQKNEDSDVESNGTQSARTSPSASPAPQPVLDPILTVVAILEMSRKESFSDLNYRNNSILPSGRSLDELGSPWHTLGSGFSDHPIPTPSPKKNNAGFSDHPIPTPSSQENNDCIEDQRVSTPAP
ncbi:hypothetical protein KBB68_03000 [Candidatus Babeliales bacterium]|nr:hypothetical protein [Candidatus Babeliales bacterium]